jgi:hypothetical protein
MFRGLLQTQNQNHDRALPLPTDVDANVFEDSSVNFRAKFARLYDRIEQLGAFTTHYWRRCVREEEVMGAAAGAAGTRTQTSFLSDAREKARISQLFEAWREAYVSDMESMREVRLYAGEDGTAAATTAKIRSTLGLHIFYELTRLYSLLHHSALMLERENVASIPREQLSDPDDYDTLFTLKSTHHPMWIELAGTYDIRDQYKDKNEDADEEVERLHAQVTDMWSRPIFSYTQSQTRLLALFLTQHLNELPTTNALALDEYRRVFHVLWLRVGTLVSEAHIIEVMDEESERTPCGDGLFQATTPYYAFCSFYLGEIMRRLFQYELIGANRLSVTQTLASTLRATAKRVIARAVNGFADEAFEDIYAQVTPEGYRFPGDDSWFHYAWPHKVHSRGACIAALRPHLYRRFFSESQITKNLALTSTSYVARLFVLRAVDEHLKMIVASGAIQWSAGVVISNEGIEMSAYMLQSGQAPLLLQVLSSWWVYHQGRVHVCDCVYEAIGVWCWLLRTHYGSQLFGCDLSAFVSEFV